MVGSVGVIVAWTQLRALGKSEKVKNTLELLRRYDSERVPFMHEGKEEAVTAAVAYARSVSQQNVTFFAQYDLSQGLNADYRLRWANLAVAMNYFKRAGALWQRGLLDNDLFFGFLAPQAIKIFAVFQELKKQRGEPTPMYGLGDFAVAAQKFTEAQELAVGISPG